MSLLTLMGSIVGFGLQILLCIKISKGKIEQNFASWILWGILEAIVAASIIAQHGNFLLPICYSVGCLIIAIAIAVKSKTISWSWFENMIAGLTIICMIVWGIAGDWFATIFSTIAVVIAGVPLLVDCYKNPWGNPFLIYSGFFVANSLSTAGGNEWSVQERLYPAACTIFTILVLLFVVRKFWLTHEVNNQNI